MIGKTRFAIIGLSLCMVGLAWSATKKSGKASTTNSGGSKAPAETVYVPVTAHDGGSPAFASSVRESKSVDAPARESEPRRFEAPAVVGPLRDYASSVGLFAGFYSAEVLGTNIYGSGYYDLFPSEQPYFFEFTAGLGTVQSGFSQSVIGADVFKRNIMITFEGLAGFSLTGSAHGAGRAGGLFPYFIAGMTYVDQGGIPFILPDGVPNFGGVLGFGQRLALPFGPKDGRWALNYGLRDHIYSQKIRTTPSLTQNFVLLVGVQKYY